MGFTLRRKTTPQNPLERSVVWSKKPRKAEDPRCASPAEELALAVDGGHRKIGHDLEGREREEEDDGDAGRGNEAYLSPTGTVIEI